MELILTSVIHISTHNCKYSALVNPVIADGSNCMVIFAVSTDINYYVIAKLYTTTTQ
jgi:hypothetical protein